MIVSRYGQGTFKAKKALKQYHKSNIFFLYLIHESVCVLFQKYSTAPEMVPTPK